MCKSVGNKFAQVLFSENVFTFTFDQFFLSVLKDSIPLFLYSNVSDEKLITILAIVSSWNAFFPLNVFKTFVLSLLFNSLAVMCLCVTFFILILLGVHWTYWICNYISCTKNPQWYIKILPMRPTKPTGHLWGCARRNARTTSKEKN